MLNLIKSRLAVLGTLPICNLNSERAFFIGSFCFPLCVRCSAIIVSILLTVTLIQIFKVKLNAKLLVVYIILIVPCLLDGIMQYFFNIESNNIKRLITGVLCGVGIGNIVMFVVQELFKILNLL